MKRFGLLGYPLGHSLSPQLHMLLNKRAGENVPKITYQLYQLTQEELENEPQKIFSLNGFNVTIPYKVSIISHLDTLDTTAKLHGAVNVVAYARDGRRVGYNTDCIGFIKTMQLNGVSISGKVCILGAGGVGRMFATECARHCCQVTIAVKEKNIPAAKTVAEDILKKLPTTSIEVQDISCLQGPFDLLINATPCGMYPHMNHSPVSEELLYQVKTVFDCIYNPSKTLLMRQAEQAGCKVIGGLGMLCWQAAAAQEIWLREKFTQEQVEQVMQELESMAHQ